MLAGARSRTGSSRRAVEAGLVAIGVHDLRDLHRRPPPQRGRRALRRRAGHGDEGGAVLPRGGDAARGRARRAARGRAALAARAARSTRRMAARFAGLDRARAAVRALRGHRRAGARGAGRRGGEPGRLRADRRRGGGAGGDRGHGAPAARARWATRARRRPTRSPTACSTSRTTRGPRRCAGARCPTCCSRGDHGRIRRWRRKEALRATRERRPDLLGAAAAEPPRTRRLLREIGERGTRGDRA